jgi:hypothetical protein
MDLDIQDLYESNKNGDFEEVIEFLQEQYGECLLQSAINGKFKLVKYWATSGQITQQYGNQALHNAATYGHVDICKYLVELGFCQLDNKMILDECTQVGHMDVVKYLFSRGYTPDYYNMDGSRMHGNYEIFYFFILSQPKRFVLAYLQTKVNEKYSREHEWALYVKPCIPIIGKKILATKKLNKHNILKIVYRPKSLHIQLIYF